MERRFLAPEAPSQVETREDGTNVITGMAAVFYRSDDPGTEFEVFPDVSERVMPSAFDNALDADDVRGLFNHDPNRVLGRTASGTLKLTKTKRGLSYEITPPKSAADVVESIQRGDISGSSFAFKVTDERWRNVDGREVREIHGVKLYDVGPVVFPAYQSTSSGVRSDDDVAECRASYERWKSEADKEALEASKRAAEDDRLMLEADIESAM